MIKWDFHKIERFVGGLKFAVISLLAFATLLTVGTFIESYYGTEFANRFLYKSFPFMAVLAGLFLCIFIRVSVW